MENTNLFYPSKASNFHGYYSNAHGGGGHGGGGHHGGGGYGGRGRRGWGWGGAWGYPYIAPTLCYYRDVNGNLVSYYCNYPY